MCLRYRRMSEYIQHRIRLLVKWRDSMKIVRRRDRTGNLDLLEAPRANRRHAVNLFAARPRPAGLPALRSSRRCFWNRSGVTIRLAIPVSSSSVMNRKPLAVPGRWRTITTPAVFTHDLMFGAREIVGAENSARGQIAAQIRHQMRPGGEAGRGVVRQRFIDRRHRCQWNLAISWLYARKQARRDRARQRSHSTSRRGAPGRTRRTHPRRRARRSRGGSVRRAR